MRILTLTSLYPNRLDPRHGIFVKARMDHFDLLNNTSRKVIAPVQYFPLLDLYKKSKFYKLNQIPLEENDGDIPVYHPRYFTIPGTNLINVTQAMTRACEKAIQKIHRQNDDFDLVDGHYLYPDGIAAYEIARKYHKPLILTARGSDVNYWMTLKKPKQDILKALNYASKIICVSQALRRKLIEHGISENKIIVIMNGVDRNIFNPKIRTEAKGQYLLSVGNLVPLKGHDLILQALTEFPDENLTIIGAGEREKYLKNRAQDLNILDRVAFLKYVSPRELAAFYANAKATILMSSMEGMPNVVLESLSMGTPVIATNVGGIPEVITPENGILLDKRSPKDLTEALRTALNKNWDHQKISEDAKYFDWKESSKKLYDCFSSLF
ncbi:MAG: glycosyltransferase [Emcibacter sp.]|nr:glycosyltransferase [Emcibacter sp.]